MIKWIYVAAFLDKDDPLAIIRFQHWHVETPDEDTEEDVYNAAQHLLDNHELEHDLINDYVIKLD